MHGVGEKTMPGYYREQARLDFRLHKIRTQGFVVGGLGFALDLACFQAYRMGLIDYVLVSGRKPRSSLDPHSAKDGDFDHIQQERKR
jgi:hypothetical protein